MTYVLVGLFFPRLLDFIFGFDFFLGDFLGDICSSGRGSVDTASPGAVGGLLGSVLSNVPSWVLVSPSPLMPGVCPVEPPSAAVIPKKHKAHVGWLLPWPVIYTF